MVRREVVQKMRCSDGATRSMKEEAGARLFVVGGSANVAAGAALQGKAHRTAAAQPQRPGKVR